MKEQALELANQADGEQQTTNVLREYLQHVILRGLFDQNLLQQLAFHGGTALRVLHELPRFSEDLDFHLRDTDHHLDLDTLRDTFAERLIQQGYDVSLSIRTDRTVQHAIVKFAGLLYELGLSPHENEQVQINIEVDTEPPGGFSLDTSPVNEYVPFVVHHHDRPTFMAGKLHALFQREYTKGRDLFDLNFYLTRWEQLSPNLAYLNNALRQTGYSGPDLTADNWAEQTADRIRKLDWTQVQQDVAPFLLRANDLDTLRKDLLIDELERR